MGFKKRKMKGKQGRKANARKKGDGEGISAGKQPAIMKGSWE